ncbi:MAG: hypothetical protein FJ135_15825 [Deltaproteobacteria bacterium]|nr:hypothetical protein [Deltaproteobacteria bacterium]
MESLNNLPLPLFDNLSPAEMARYDKQLRLPDWGLASQKKLKAATVFLAGADGLVSSAALNLVAAGLGHLRLVDAHRVALPDLCDHGVYREKDLNKYRAMIMGQRLREANPFVEVEASERKVCDQNALKLIQGVDLILADLRDGRTASVLNRAAIKSKKPLVLAWTQGMRGYVATLKPGQGLCLECTALKANNHGKPALMGPMSSILGGVMALEAMRLLAGLGPALLERLFGFDGDLCLCLEEPIRKNKDCSLCSPKS